MNINSNIIYIDWIESSTRAVWAKKRMNHHADTHTHTSSYVYAINEIILGGSYDSDNK